jgi:hypothetical protein
MKAPYLILLAAGLTSCSTPVPPALTSAHPANPEAREGADIPRQSSLRADETTRKSHALLSAAQKEQEQWDASGPVSGTPEAAPKEGNMPGMKHEHH